MFLDSAVVGIKDKQWDVEVAHTSAELAQGLSGRVSIPSYTGMLFDLGSERIVMINAYEMLFPLSVVFIGESLRVTEIVPLLEPGDDITTGIPCRYFLETSLGEVDDVEPGDLVAITGYTPTTTSSIIELMVTVLIVAMMIQMMMKVVKEVK